jgi:hypothetical protein
MRIFALIALLALFSGCKNSPARSSNPPVKLANLIAGADHIIITNRLAGTVTRYRGFSLTVSGIEARKIVQAVSSAEHSAPTDSIYDWDLQFFRDTHLLADIHLQGSHFVFEDEEYFDGRTLERLYDDLLKRTGHEF